MAPPSVLPDISPAGREITRVEIAADPVGRNMDRS